MNPGELRQKRAALLNEARSVLDAAEAAARGLTSDEEGQFNLLLSKANGLAALIEEAEGGQVPRADRGSLDNVIADLSKSQGTVAAHRETNSDGGGVYVDHSGRQVRMLQPTESFAAAVRHELRDGIRPEELSTGRWIRGLLLGDWRGAAAERRAMETIDSTLGGFLVPSPLSARVIDLARSRAVMLAAGARTVPMESQELTLARLENDPQVFWKQESALGAEDTGMSFGAIRLRARTLVGLIRVSLELIEDAPNAGDVIEAALAAALGLELDRSGLMGGSGSNQEEPTGVYNSTGIGVQRMAAVGALTNYSKFSEASQKAAERNGAAAAAILAPRDLFTLDRLADTTGQPLRPPASWDALRKLSSTQVPVNLGPGLNESAAFVGDFGQVILGLRKSLTVEVAREAEGTFERLQVLIRAHLRADWNFEHPEHLIVLDNITTV